ncbi:urease accessory protein UreE [Pseudovibrio exalbescens]|uniref:urease accessory protein UreE n=1 Tax=Pseudovibrio exalbescens TaxID=197461 RepID=UPI000C9B901D|nr:urease accessory protein UreE [Pseudovibrio exalbescens]
MFTAHTYKRAGEYSGEVLGTVTLSHDERHLRRKVLTTDTEVKVLFEVADAVSFDEGDAIETEGGTFVVIKAAVEPLYEVKARDALHHAQLCWHLGNRHLPSQIELDRIVILKDHVIKEMLEGLGATITEIEGAFSPVRGAYHKSNRSSSHSHSHGHSHHHSHDHSHD